MASGSSAKIELGQPKNIDVRVKILQDFLSQYDSPLVGEAYSFVKYADEYDLDFRLVAAISGVESTFGKRIPGGYNGWGWGVYGTQALYFDSWKDGIYTVSKGLKEDYVSRGLTDPYSMNKRYATSPRWGRNVTFFMNEIEKFAKEYENSASAEVKTSPTRVAASSALLTYNSQ